MFTPGEKVVILGVVASAWMVLMYVILYGCSLGHVWAGRPTRWYMPGFPDPGSIVVSCIRCGRTHEEINDSIWR